jgi:hypothetical protein
MANRKITLKRNNDGTVDNLFPKTTADQIVWYDSVGDDYINVFDSNNKLKAAHIPSFLVGGLNFRNSLDLTASGGSDDTIHQLLTAKEGSGYESTLEAGDFWIVQTAGVVSGFSAGAGGNVTYWLVNGEEGEYTDEPSDAVGEDITLEVGDYIVFTGSETQADTTTVIRYYFSIINNDQRLATSSRPGLISATNQAKLDGIAESADNYGGFSVVVGEDSTVIGSGDSVTFVGDGGAIISESAGTITIFAPEEYSHPTYATRSIDTTGVDVLDTFTSDAFGHITAITTRTLPNATVNDPGVMSAADKKKVDETNVVRYANADDSASTYGYIYFDED